MVEDAIAADCNPTVGSTSCKLLDGGRGYHFQLADDDHESRELHPLERFHALLKAALQAGEDLDWGEFRSGRPWAEGEHDSSSFVRHKWNPSHGILVLFLFLLCVFVAPSDTDSNTQ